MQSIGGEKYMLIIRDDSTRFNAVYFIRSKDDVPDTSGVPCPVETVRTDDAADFKDGAFADLCQERGIRQEFTTADRPQCNRVAERGVAMVESAGQAAIIQAGFQPSWNGNHFW